MRGSSAKRSALHGAGEPDCELDPRSLEDPHWRLRAILPWSPRVRFRFGRGPHAGGTGVEERVAGLDVHKATVVACVRLASNPR